MISCTKKEMAKGGSGLGQSMSVGSGMTNAPSISARHRRKLRHKTGGPGPPLPCLRSRLPYIQLGALFTTYIFLLLDSNESGMNVI